MKGRRKSVMRLYGLPVLLAAACSTSASPGQPVASTPSPTPPPPRPDVGFLSPTQLRLPGGCAVEVVTERLNALARDVSRGDGTAVAAHFLPGPDLRWEVREHFDPPNGTLGALRTLDAISAFTKVMHTRGEVWTAGQVVPPSQYSDGAPAVYGASITAMSTEGPLASPAKVVVDCPTGLLTHVVGPST